MFINTADLPQDALIETDVCVIGAGLAGLSIAREYLGRTEKVVVLEAGGEQFSRTSQLLYRARVSGAPNHAATHSRFRVYGGSGTRWTGQCVPFEAIDFERRKAVADSGWPFDLAHLQPYYERAGDVFELDTPHADAPRFDVQAWERREGALPPIVSQALSTSIVRFAEPSDLGAVMYADLAASTNVTVYLDATAVELTANEGVNQIDAVNIRSLQGRTATCRAKHVVLAGGGIENPRLLLASNRQASAGLGNEHDLVGRYFMDHPYLTTGYWEPSVTAQAAGMAAGLHVIDDYRRVAQERGAHAVFTLKAALRRREGLSACVGYFIHRERFQLDAAYHAPGGQAVAHIAELIRGERMRDTDLAASLKAVITDSRAALETVRGDLQARVRPHPRLALRICAEATPCARSRVTLGTQRDRLGMRPAQVDWHVNQEDWRGVARFKAVLGESLDSAGLGRLVDDDSLDASGWPISMTGGKHHMGGTRMHEDPRRGVVDASSRVHGLANLYVAGSSCFPTGGWANPTFTLVALAIRLADHLRRLG